MKPEEAIVHLLTVVEFAKNFTRYTFINKTINESVSNQLQGGKEESEKAEGPEETEGSVEGSDSNAYQNDVESIEGSDVSSAGALMPGIDTWESPSPVHQSSVRRMSDRRNDMTPPPSRGLRRGGRGLRRLATRSPGPRGRGSERLPKALTSGGRTTKVSRIIRKIN